MGGKGGRDYDGDEIGIDLIDRSYRIGKSTNGTSTVSDGNNTWRCIGTNNVGEAINLNVLRISQNWNLSVGGYPCIGSILEKINRICCGFGIETGCPVPDNTRTSPVVIEEFSYKCLDDP